MNQALLAVVGPTGSGKSSLALHLAETFGGEIVNCDSMQLYRGFDIGTAKTAVADRRGIPHHLIDILAPDAIYSAGDYSRDARAAIAEISGRGRLPIVTGGTGFYLKALLDGLPALPGRDPDLRVRLAAMEARKPGRMHRMLARLEPQAAARIHANDTQKLTRALEVRIRTRAALPSTEEAEPLGGYRTLVLGLSPDRAKLAEILEARARAMFAQGLLEEVRGLLANGASAEAKPFESLGYNQALRHLRGEVSLDEAVESTFIDTRQYAKRQWTWFRRDSRVIWLEGFGTEPDIAAQARGLLQLQLAPPC